MGRREAQGGWWQRNWGWCLGCGCLAPILVLGALALGAYWFGGRLITSNDAIEMALTRVRTDPRAVEALGEPIETRLWRDHTTIRFSGDGELRARIGVAGPRGEGRLEIEAHRENGDGPWRLDRLLLHPRDGDGPLDLLERPPPPEAAAPAAWAGRPKGPVASRTAPVPAAGRRSWRPPHPPLRAGG